MYFKYYKVKFWNWYDEKPPEKHIVIFKLETYKSIHDKWYKIIPGEKVWHEFGMDGPYDCANFISMKRVSYDCSMVPQTLQKEDVLMEAQSRD